MSTGTDTLDSIQSALTGVSPSIGQNSDSSADWMIYKGFMEDGAGTADRAICLYETPGKPPLEAWAIDYPGCQIVVRGVPDDYTAVRQKIQDIYYALHAQEVAIGAAFVYFYAVQSGPLSMGRDETRRPRLCWNFRSMRNRPT